MGDELAALVAVLDCVQDALTERLVGGIGTLEGRPESWGFVGARTRHVLEQLQLALRCTSAKRPTFLECGSGFGFVAALARELGFCVTGIEVTPGYVAISRGLFPSVQIEEADLLTFDRFGDFDVAYYFRPFADVAVQGHFERRVEQELRPGGIVLANRKVTHDWKESGTFEVLSTDDSLFWALRKNVSTVAK
jgi:SAM-dependent methyltransferase